MNNLFICKTPYQIIVATQMVTTMFKQDMNDIIIEDSIADYDSLYHSIRTAGIFHQVYKHDGKKKYGNKSKIYFIICGLIYLLGFNPYERDWKDKKYDRFLFGTTGKSENILYRCLKRNQKLEVYMFEDGFSTYSKGCSDFFHKMTSKKTLKEKMVKAYRWLTYEVFMNLKGIYAFSPQLFDWTPQVPIYQIEKIDPKDREKVLMYNKIFGVSGLKDSYHEKVIFFEESYFADGIDVGDEKIIRQIAKIVRESDFLLKLHPRNPINRFQNTDINVNKSTSIPWEIIALNIQLSDKILVTIASGSALTTLMNISIAPKKIIMLMDCNDINRNDLTPSVDMLRKIAKYFPEFVWLPNQLKEAYRYLMDSYESVE